MSEKNVAAEVAVKLRLDSNAKEEAQHVAAGLKQVDSQVSKTAGGWKSKIGAGVQGGLGLAKVAVLGVAGATAAAGAALVGLAVEGVHAFSEADEKIRATAGSLGAIDRNSNSFENLTALAGEVKDATDQIGISAGVSGDQVAQAFNDVIEHGGKTIDQTRALVANMAQAGKVVPGGLEAIAGGYEQIELGMVRAKNPIVQLISSTGTLKGSAKEVAREMQKMSIDKQMALAEKAIGKMATKVKDVPLTLGQMSEGLKVIGGNVYEAIGGPIVKALTPVFGKVHAFIVENQDKLYAMGDALGSAISKAVEIVGPFIDATINAFKESWNDISSAMDAIYGPAKDTFGYIYENKEGFAATFGAVLKDLIKVGTFLIKVFASIRDNVLAVVSTVAKSGILGSDMQKFVGEEKQKGIARDVRGQIFEKGSMGGQEVESRRKDYVQSAIEGGMNAEQANADFEKLYRGAMNEHQEIMKNADQARVAAMNDDAKGFAAAFDQAAAKGDEAAMKYVASFLDGNESMVQAIAKAGPNIFEGGIGKLTASLKGMGMNDVATELAQKTKPSLGTPSKTSITQNFNGAITVKQDFRDQDPDRVAVTFKRDMEKVGTNRLQSRLAPAFSF